VKNAEKYPDNRQNASFPSSSAFAPFAGVVRLSAALIRGDLFTSNRQSVYTLGRMLQVLALVILPVGLFSLGDQPVYLFASLGFGVAMFMIGRYLEGYAAR
jgi:hypothetical protein